ncbi:CotH kinase family protein [Rudanella lutea]|uniref:CotH kinase family protein n=1 Tax=Rudanella lutea TaxID=451374 RepID=UPI0005C74AB2|nr:CotH kinase family protein [Rudanella lutea]
MNVKRCVYISLLCLFLYTTARGQTFTSSDLPILLINTGGQPIINEPKIRATLTLIDNETGKRNHITDKPALTSPIGIELRGSSSQDFFPKKPYGFELRDSGGSNSVKLSLVGMPAESDWILNPTYNDKTLLREALAYDLNRRISRYYTPRFRYCEVVLNNGYDGLYLLQEKIKRDKNRVDITSIKKTDLSGDALTGGYLLKIDKFEGSMSESWMSAQAGRNTKQVNILIDRPKPADLALEQFQYIKQYVTDFETALAGDAFADPTNGYARYLDVESAVDYMLLTELCRNVDGYRLSTFFYKDRDSRNGKLTMGPIWDYNLAFANASYCNADKPEGWAYQFNEVCPNDPYPQPFWWERLLQDPAFAARLNNRYQTLRQGVLATPRIHAYLDSTGKSITDARIRNFTRWPVIGTQLWPNDFVGKTYEDEVNYLKDWVTKRLAWLDGAMPQLATEPALTLLISPNPTAETVTVRYQLDQRTDVRLVLTDLQGRRLFSTEVMNQEPGPHAYTVPPGQLPTGPGVYLLTVQATGYRQATRRVVRY